jgi:hypothetical protein
MVAIGDGKAISLITLVCNLSIIEKGASTTRATAKTSLSITLRQIFLGKTAPGMPACEEQGKSPDMPDKRKPIHTVDALLPEISKTLTSAKMQDFIK